MAYQFSAELGPVIPNAKIAADFSIGDDRCITEIIILSIRLITVYLIKSLPGFIQIPGKDFTNRAVFRSFIRNGLEACGIPCSGITVQVIGGCKSLRLIGIAPEIQICLMLIRKFQIINTRILKLPNINVRCQCQNFEIFPGQKKLQSVITVFEIMLLQIPVWIQSFLDFFAFV